MLLPFRRNHPEPEPFWRRVDRLASEINPFLLILAVGLVILYLTCVIGLLIKVPLTRLGDGAVACSAAAAPPPRFTETASGL